jgi:hypothetical protein
MTSDDRFTWGLITDVLDVLERHGYHRHDNQHTGQALEVIFDLAYVYEGARDISPRAYLQPASSALHAEPAPSGPDADAVILTDTEVGTVIAALDIAADYKRDHVAACAACADQSCLACQSRLRDAQVYDQMAAQMQQTAEVARLANSGQPEPGSPVTPSTPPQPAADKEAGQ